MAAAFTIQVVAGGIVFYGFTSIFQPLRAEFGWSYAQISMAASLRGLEETIMSPITGFLVDRIGPRKMIFAGGLLASSGLLLLSRTESLLMFYAAFVMMAVGMGACSTTILLGTAAHWFRKRLGLAAGIIICGFGFGGIWVPFFVRLIDALGWRSAMTFTSLGVLGTVLPLSLLMRHKAEQYGYALDGQPATNGPGNKTQIDQAEVETTARQALQSQTFWRFGIALFLMYAAVGAVVTHVMPYLESVGIERGTASLVASAIPLVSITGRFGMGWAADKIDNRWLMGAGFAMMGLGLLFFGYLPAAAVSGLALFVILFAVGYGGNNTVRASLLGRYFGRRNYGAIFGMVMGVGMAGHVVGAPLAGWVFDTWGRYQGIWLAFIALMALAALLVLTARAAKYR